MQSRVESREIFLKRGDIVETKPYTAEWKPERLMQAIWESRDLTMQRREDSRGIDAESTYRKR